MFEALIHQSASDYRKGNLSASAHHMDQALTHNPTWDQLVAVILPMNLPIPAAWGTRLGRLMSNRPIPLTLAPLLPQTRTSVMGEAFRHAA